MESTQMFCDDLPMPLQDILEISKTCQDALCSGEDVTLLPDYKKLTSLCIQENKIVNTNASLLLLSMHSKKTTDVDELLNIFKQLLPSAKDITGILISTLEILKLECNTSGKCLKCLYNLNTKLHPLYIALEYHPHFAETALDLISNAVKEEYKMIDSLYPFLHYLLHFSKSTNLLPKKWEFFKLIFDAMGFTFTSNLLLWMKVPDVAGFENIIFGPCHDAMCSFNTNGWLLYLTHLACAQSQSIQICIKSLTYIRSYILRAPAHIQSIIALALAQQLCSGPSLNLTDLIELVKVIALEGNVGCEVMWTITIGLILCTRYTLVDKAYICELSDHIYIQSYSRRRVCFPFRCSNVIKHICVRYPFLNNSVQMLRLFSGFRKEKNVLTWLDSLKNNNDDSLTLKIVLYSISLAGNYNIRKHCYKVMRNWGGEITINFYLWVRENRRDLSYYLFQNVCRTSRSKSEKHCIIDCLDEMMLVSRYNGLLYQDVSYHLWYSDHSSEFYDLLMFLFNIKLRTTHQNEGFLRKVHILHKMANQTFIPEDKLRPILTKIFNTYNNYIYGELACALAVDTMNIVWNKGVFEIEDIFDVIMNLSMCNIGIAIKNSVCRILSSIPRLFRYHDTLLNKCAFILWSYAVGEEKCELAYSALKKYRLFNFKKYCLPKSCISHMCSDTEDISGMCWLHLLMSGWLDETIDLFRYLLWKEFRMSRFQSDTVLAFTTNVRAFISTTQCENEWEVNCTYVCLGIMNAKLNRDLPFKSYDSLARLVMDHKNALSKYALILLIRQAPYNQRAKKLLQLLISDEEIMSTNVMTLFQVLPDLERVCRVSDMKNIVNCAFNKGLKADKTAFFESFNSFYLVKWETLLGDYILHETKNLFDTLDPLEETFERVVKCLAKFEMQSVLNIMPRNRKLLEDYKKLIHLYAEFGKNTQTVMCLRLILEAVTEMTCMKGLGLLKICEVLQYCHSDPQLDVWPYYVLSLPDQGNNVENNFHFRVFIHSVDILSGAYLYGSAADAIYRLPHACAKMYINHKKTLYIATILHFWKNNNSLMREFRQICFLTLMAIRDNLPEGTLSPEFWRNVICDCQCK